MFSNIKMKYLVFCEKPVEDKFLAPSMRQNSIHLQFFIIASVLLQNRFFLIKSSPIQHAYLCGTHILERITKYPELTYMHVQQLFTLLSNGTAYKYIFPIYSPKMIFLWWATNVPFIKTKEVCHTLRFLHTTHVPKIHHH